MDERLGSATFRLLPLIAACCIAPAAHAAPLSHVQRVGQDDAGPAGIDRDIQFVLGEDRLFGASNDTILNFERDPTTGRLSFVEQIVRFEDGDPVPTEGDLRPRLALAVVRDGRLVVSTRARDPESCPEGPVVGCGVDGTTTFSIDGGGRLEKVGSDGVGTIFPLMRSSPDGRHVYAVLSNGASLAALEVDASGRPSPVETYAELRADGTFSQVKDLVFPADGDFLYVLSSSGNSSNARHTITTLARDAATGRLVSVSDAEVGPDAFGLDAEASRELAISADGTAIYAGSRSPTDEAGVGLARFDVSEAGAVTFAGVALTDPAPTPPITSRIRSLAVGADGRLVVIAEYDTPTDRQLLYLFTVDDSGETTYRGAEMAGSDGVIAGDLQSVDQVEFSDDGAYVYVSAERLGISTGGSAFSVFAAHADLQVGIETPVNALAGGEVGATVRLVNAGPATSHGLRATIEASGDIVGIDGDCDVDGATATCRVDELLARGAAEIAVRLRAPTAGEATLSVAADQYQTDLDASSNSASATVPVVADAGDASGASSGGDGGGGGCSIATGDGHGTLPGWLMAASVLGLRRRAKRFRDSATGRG